MSKENELQLARSDAREKLEEAMLEFLHAAKEAEPSHDPIDEVKMLVREVFQ